MNKQYYIFLSFFILLFFQGCTNSLYHGEIDVLNSDYQERKAVLYWTKTSPFLGKDKAGPAILMTECSTRRLTFAEKEDGLYFFGDPGRDKLANLHPVDTQNVICGKIIDKKQFTKIKPGPVQVDILCMSTYDEFSITKGSTTPAYIKASKEPYTFEMTESSNWSWFGETPEAPSPPECRK